MVAAKNAMKYFTKGFSWFHIMMIALCMVCAITRLLTRNLEKVYPIKIVG